MNTNNIFLDTSIFISNNYFASRLIKRVIGLAQKTTLNLLITDVIKRELDKNIVEDYNLFYSAIKKNSIWRNNNEFDFLKDQKKKDLQFCKQTLSKFQKLIDSQIIVNISTPNEITSTLLDRYFNNLVPFNNQCKKNEFLDGFILLTIDNWCMANSQKAILFSSDEDQLNYSSKNFSVRNDLSKFVEQFVDKTEPFNNLPVNELVNKIIELNRSSINQQIQYLFENEFLIDLTSKLLSIRAIIVNKIHYLSYHIIEVTKNTAIVEYEVKINYSYEEPSDPRLETRKITQVKQAVTVPFELSIDLTKGIVKGGYDLIQTDAHWNKKIIKI